jgi:malate dehydrogenase (quinone)
METISYDVAIIGAGVTGTALLHVLTRYTTVGHVALFETNDGPAEVNSHPLNNAQTSHDGGTETNYNLAHALEVQRAAVALRRYVAPYTDDELYRVTNRMVLGIGAGEVAALEQRYAEFSAHYPDLRLVYADELRAIEPKVMEGRAPDEPVCALVSQDGYAINYQKLARSFLANAVARRSHYTHLFFRRAIERVVDRGDHYELIEKGGCVHRARVVVFAAGAYSLHFAHQLGYGREYAILSVAGSFFSAGEQLRGKVYRVQTEGLPFAAIHGDPDVLDPGVTRFGPTTKPLPLMMRHHPETFWDFMRLGFVSLRGITALVRILARKGLLGYVLVNTLYDLPFIGTWAFLSEARKIIPTLRYRELHIRKGAGGIRPQLVNLTTGQLEMGDKTLVGRNSIFNTTPSPGASVCLANAIRDAHRVVEFFGGSVRIDDAAIERELGFAAYVEEAA